MIAGPRSTSLPTTGPAPGSAATHGALDPQALRSVAVIVHWGEPQGTLSCAADHLGAGAFDSVVVVANDGTRQDPPDPRIRWLVAPRNLGYGAACQWAATQMDAERYAFLNADVLLPGDASRRCLEALDAPGVAVTGPVLLHHDDTLQSACGTWTALRRAPTALRWPTAPVTPCGWVTGAALFCRREVITQVGFDGSYFLGLEDADLCDRVAEMGWGVAVVADAQGRHSGGATMPERRWRYYSLRNPVWFARKRRSRARAAACLAWGAFALLPRIMVADVVKRRGFSLSYSALRGVVDAGRRLPPFGQPWSTEPVPQSWTDWTP